MKTEILNLIDSSLLLDIETKNSLRLSAEKLSEFQMKKLLEILKIEKKFLGKVLEEVLQNPAKKADYEKFMKSFSMGIKSAFKDKEIQINIEEKTSLKNLDLELENI